MARCPSCNEKVSSDDDECPHCGEEIGEEVPRRGKRGGGKSSSSGPTIAIVLAVVIGGMCLVIPVLIALLLPAVQQAREAARRTQCKNNLKQIALAMHNYHDTYKLFPGAHLNDDDGNPRLSWRVSILPFIDESTRFSQYNFNEAWNSPANSGLMHPAPRVYLCPSYIDTMSDNSCYLAITGDHTVLGAGKCRSMRDILDGTSNTLMVVEACQLNVPWMEPRDLNESEVTKFGTADGVSSKHMGGAHVALADGAVRFISVNVDPRTVKSLITIDGGEAPSEF